MAAATAAMLQLNKAAAEALARAPRGRSTRAPTSPASACSATRAEVAVSQRRHAAVRAAAVPLIDGRPGAGRGESLGRHEDEPVALRGRGVRMAIALADDLLALLLRSADLGRPAGVRGRRARGRRRDGVSGRVGVAAARIGRATAFDGSAIVLEVAAALRHASLLPAGAASWYKLMFWSASARASCAGPAPARAARPAVWRLSQVIPGLAVIWVIVIVLILAFVLDRGLFRPIGRVMREREAAVRIRAGHGAVASRRRPARRPPSSSERPARRRQEIYREMDENRRQANERRAAVLAETRREVETARPRPGPGSTRRRPTRRRVSNGKPTELGDAIAERVLGRKV